MILDRANIVLLCKISPQIQYPLTILAFIFYSCLYFSVYKIIFHFRISFHIYCVVFYCEQEFSFLSYLSIILLSVQSHGLFPLQHKFIVHLIILVLKLSQIKPVEIFQAGFCVICLPKKKVFYYFHNIFFMLYFALKMVTVRADLFRISWSR